MKKFFISSAYIYPICPLNINHAKMFVIADVFARYHRSKGKEVFFPIASHYSGNTAHKIASIFQQIYDNKGKKNKEEKKIWHLYKNVYSTPNSILPTFTKPLSILNFYTQEILWELKSLDVSGDYEAFYTTKQKDFISFIQTIISLYEEHNLLTQNSEKKLALNYEDMAWKNSVLAQIEKTKFTKKSQKNNVFSVLNNNSLRNDWSFLRDNGFGVPYKNKWTIDPMFDSELFTVFDIYAKFSNLADPDKKDEIFRGIFEVLQGQKTPTTELEKNIVEWLPCDLFVCEEHLKNWVLKKFYAENALLDHQYHTKHYFVLGMGLLNGNRMSASRGNAILASDIINQYGPTKARLIILMQGGHPSKTYY
jgi:leucyl-tRNA synthetase